MRCSTHVFGRPLLQNRFWKTAFARPLLEDRFWKTVFGKPFWENSFGKNACGKTAIYIYIYIYIYTNVYIHLYIFMSMVDLSGFQLVGARPIPIPTSMYALHARAPTRVQGIHNFMHVRAFVCISIQTYTRASGHTFLFSCSFHCCFSSGKFECTVSCFEAHKCILVSDRNGSSAPFKKSSTRFGFQSSHPRPAEVAESGCSSYQDQRRSGQDHRQTVCASEAEPDLLDLWS